ncbi:hypothetical protein Cch01nite_37290 [Cellulomonas chitinilytica]|uniref:Uncharacterized protein n=1 Tax=Cellulomonas chitinilytica TaxID=398759 RepID=A0A919P5C4_9CELL|nr:hypothetical protein [Cellulomonas chitinilytica]GIG23005.1 hypothetical protein Cch01nite_37290 [Cellulomonas chitinilytica]
MNDDQTPAPSDADDPAFARLRAADPAAGVEPDLARVRAALTGVTADVAAGATAAPGASGAAGGTSPAGDERVVVEEITVDELGAARARKRPARWLQVAAAVAGVVVIGGAGYVAGDAARGGGATGTAEPAIALQNPAVAPEAARDSAGTATSMSTDKASAWFGGRTVFSSRGLSDEGGSGDAWALDAAGVFSAATAAHLAEVLHVTGEPVLQYGSWTVGPQDGAGASVTLSPDGTASVSYYDPTRDPWACVRSAPDKVQGTTTDEGASAGGGAGSSTGAAIAPGEPTGPSGCTPSGAPAPDADAAKAQARDLMSALGVDPAGYELEVVDSGTPQAASVSAYQVLDGARTGVTWSFTVLGDGVQAAWGSLAPLVELGTYDVVSPVEAVERLGDPRFGGASGGMMPLAADARAVDGATTEMMPAPEATPTVPATPTAGAKLGWPVQEVVITKARLGVALTTLPDGASVLVPTYELSDADGSTWTVIAVVDDQLDFSPVG